LNLAGKSGQAEQAMDPDWRRSSTSPAVWPLLRTAPWFVSDTANGTIRLVGGPE